MLDHRIRIILAFVLHASSTGGLHVRLPEIQAALGISEAVYGLVLLGMPAGVLFGSLLSPGQIERFGPRRVMALGLVMATALQILAALAPNAASLAAMMAVYGVFFACTNVSINVEANRFETRHAARIMSLCHGWWALGFLATSLLAAGCIRLGASPLVQFTAHAAVMVALTAILVLPMPDSGTPGQPQAHRRFAIPTRGVVLIGLWALAGILLEGATRGWIVIYLRDALGAAEDLAALALPAVVLTQTGGRFVADALIARYGVVTVARVSSVLLGVGIGVLAGAPTVPIALLGCLLVGGGFAITMPQGFAAAGRRPERPPTETVASFATLATMIGFVGPPLFGLLAETIGLRAAFALLLPVTFVSVAMAGCLKPTRSG